MGRNMEMEHFMMVRGRLGLVLGKMMWHMGRIGLITIIATKTKSSQKKKGECVFKLQNLQNIKILKK